MSAILILILNSFFINHCTKFGLRLGYACQEVRHKHGSFAHGHYLFRCFPAQIQRSPGVVP